MPVTTPENPSKSLVNFANFVLGLGIAFSIVAVALSGYRMTSLSDASESLQFYQLTLLTGVIFAALFGFGLRLADSSKVNLALLTLSITVPIVGLEAYLEFSSSSLQPIPITKQQTDVLNDARTKIQVIDDFRSIGVDAYPNVSGSQFIATNGLPTRLSEENIYPLGAIANKTTVYCNESGEWTIFESDEHGFNNPKGFYLKNNIDIMLTGDSFTEGACVRPNESIAALLRASGFNVISLGKGGNGSLLEFASFKEYAEPLQPKIVLWVHYANDLDDLINKEMQSSFLMNYLNDDEFSQNLISRQDEIDDVLRDYVYQKYVELREISLLNRYLPHLIRIFTLTNIRYLTSTINGIHKSNLRSVIYEEKKEDQPKFNYPTTIYEEYVLNYSDLFAAYQKSGSDNMDDWGRQHWHQFGQHENRSLDNLDSQCLDPHTPAPPVENIFRTIILNAKQIVSRWDGKLYFVWLHSRERYEHNTEWAGYYREFVLCTVKDLDLPIIDIHRTKFLRYSDPLSLFPSEARHYNAKGYRLVSETIAERLRNDGH
jgi:ABC-type transport system involved in multi-copper enzyme maturation permease subunit